MGDDGKQCPSFRVTAKALAVLAARRFNENALPKTNALDRDRSVVHAIIRGFATQFLPEVQTETDKWAKKSFEEKLNALNGLI